MSLHINVWSDIFFTEVFEVSAFLTQRTDDSYVLFQAAKSCEFVADEAYDE